MNSAIYLTSLEANFIFASKKWSTFWSTLLYRVKYFSAGGWSPFLLLNSLYSSDFPLPFETVLQSEFILLNFSEFIEFLVENQTTLLIHLNYQQKKLRKLNENNKKVHCTLWCVKKNTCVMRRAYDIKCIWMNRQCACLKCENAHTAMAPIFLNYIQSNRIIVHDAYILCPNSLYSTCVFNPKIKKLPKKNQPEQQHLHHIIQPLQN